MHRFFVNPDQIRDDQITILGEDIEHIKVLRIKENEPIEICDGIGSDYICKIVSESKKQIDCQIIDRQKSLGENDYHITLFQGMPKKTKLEEIIQKNVELGVNAIIPFYSSRTVKKGNEKPERYHKIAYAAAKQSKRGMVPTITEAIRLKDIVQMVKDYDCFIIAYEDEQTVSLPMALNNAQKPSKIAVLIGSEGGLSAEEVQILQAVGGIAVSLGHRILRTETAGMTVIAQINYYFDTLKEKHE